MRVLKFGGTSVRDAQWIDKSLTIAGSQLGHGIVLVSSAMSKTTDKLQDIALQAEKGDLNGADKLVDELRNTHLTEAEKLMGGQSLEKCKSELDKLFAELRSVVKGLALLKERSRRSNDLILSFGERFSTILISQRASAMGIDTELLDARQFIKTDDSFTQANLLQEQTDSLVRKMIKPKSGALIVTQGFIASTQEGITTTLGRNQSDYTAIVLGAALDAEEVQIWTDVDGIMTSDPRLVPLATTISSLSYREAAELAHFGAKVIHPLAIQPAERNEIPICVRNTGNPESEGTRIVGSLPSEGPKAIAFKKGITVVNIASGRMLQVYGFLKAIFEIFERYKTSIDLVATSEVSVSMTIENVDYLEGITRDLKSLGAINTEKNQSIVCLVGQDLWKSSEIISRVFSTLKKVPIRMISLGSSDTNLSLVVPQEQAEETVRSLHKEFFETNKV
jgi:aspartate kinase